MTVYDCNCKSRLQISKPNVKISVHIEQSCKARSDKLSA